MKAKNLLVIGALTMGFVGLAPAQASSQPPPGTGSRGAPKGKPTVQICTTTTCTHKVMVTPGSPCTVRLDPDVMVVTGNKDVDVAIQWIIGDEKFVFTPKGIDWTEDSRAAAKKEFVDQGGQDTNKWEMIDKNSQRGVFYYNVTVIRRDGKQTCKLDPPIINTL
jgi:hypothetical protein